MDACRDRSRAVYVIQVRGELGADWQSYLGSVAMTPARRGPRPSVTTLTTRLVDQAALRGLLCTLWDLNLQLISVRRLRMDAGKEE